MEFVEPAPYGEWCIFTEGIHHSFQNACSPYSRKITSEVLRRLPKNEKEIAELTKPGVWNLYIVKLPIFFHSYTTFYLQHNYETGKQRIVVKFVDRQIDEAMENYHDAIQDPNSLWKGVVAEYREMMRKYSSEIVKLQNEIDRLKKKHNAYFPE